MSIYRQLPLIVSFFITTTAFATVVTPATEQEAQFLTQHGLADKTVEEMVNTIDTSPLAQPLPYRSAVTPNELIIENNGKQYIYPLQEKFYLSFAPFINKTHPCLIHSLSGCQAELANTTFNVKINDSEGKSIIDQDMTSGSNGFVGVWLPRNINGTLEVTYNGKKAQTVIATHRNSQTCLTTLQLK